MNDHEFVDAFEACAIAGADFHHADHVRLAWIYLREHPLIEAIERFTTSLQRFARHHGVPLPRDHHLGLFAADPRTDAAQRRAEGLGVFQGGEPRSLRSQAVDPRTVLRAGDAELGPRAQNLHTA